MSERGRRWVRGCLLLGLAVMGELAEGQRAADHVGARWGTEEGLPHNAVTALLQSRDGYLWVGTAAGLARFDGLRFVPVSDERAPHLGHTYIWALHEDPDDTLWIGTGDGLTRRDSDGFTTWTTRDGLPVNFVRALARDGDGVLWVGTYGGGVCRLGAGGFACFGGEDGLSNLTVNALHVDGDGTLWVASDAGLYHWGGGGFEGVALGEGVMTLAEASGTLWLGTARGLVEHRGADVTEALAAAQPLGPVRALLPDGDGTLWVGTETGGLFCAEAGRLAPFESRGLIVHDDVRALLRDREGNLWVGTNGGGLTRLREGRVHVVATEEGLPSDVVNAVLEDRQGSVWLGTNGGLARLDPEGRIRTITRADGLPAERVFALAEGADGALWIGTNGGGLARYADGRFDTYTSADGLPGDVVFGLYADRAGRVWAGGQGLAVWDGERFETYAARDGLADGIIVAFAEEPGGALWFGSDDAGLSRFEGGRFVTYTTEDGLPSDAVRALLLDGAGTLWVGTRGGGIARFDGERFTALTPEHGLPDAIVFHLLEDERGALWANTGRVGIARLQKAEVEAVLRGEAERISPLVLGRADGLRSTEGAGGFHPSGWRGRDGRLWFATHRGVAVVDPARIGVHPVPPPVHVEEVLVNDLPVAVDGGALRLGPDAERVEIRYTGLGFADPRRVRFRYQLEGQDEGWRDGGTRRSRTYDNLAPGRYTFRVTAANADGVWNAEPATLMLVVVPPWWRTPWAMALWGLALGAGLYGGVRWRERSLTQRTEELEALVAERTAQVEAQAEQLRTMDRAKSQFFANLSHEFRTPLTLILGPIDRLLETADSDAERALLAGMQTQADRLLRLVNQLLDLSRLDAGGMPLRTRHADLAAFLRTLVGSFAGLADARGVTLDVRLDPPSLGLAFDAEKVEQIVGNLLANALRFTPVGGKVQLGLEDDDAHALVCVRDTGPGIPPEAIGRIFDRFYQAHPSTDGLGTGIGLALARELTALHGGTLEVESAPGFGSTFTVRLPKSLSATAPDAPAPIPAIAPIGVKTEDDDEPAVPPADAPLVLIVEDHDDVRAFVRDVLRRRYRTTEAATGEEALDAARAERPDLVVSDVMMPGMDGVELVRRLRADDALAAVPVVLLTARADEESRLEGLGAGADDYLAKPFSAAELVARAENLIELRRALRARYSGEILVGPSKVAVPSADTVFLDRVRAVVEEHIGNTAFGVEWLADEVHLSRRQLHRRLRALTGLSTVGFIRMMRLERASQLLEQRAGTVAEIARAVGFEDASYFARLFRQAYGRTPSDVLAGEEATERT